MADPYVLPYSPARKQGRDQCNAFATVAAMESWVLRNAPHLQPRLPLSEDDLWKVSGRRDDLQLVLKAAGKVGIVDERMDDDRRKMRPRDRVNRPDLFWRLRTRTISVAPDETPRQMTAALKAGHPLITSIYIDEHFARYDGRGPYSRSGSVIHSAHAICVIGYDAAEHLWIAKNSLGPGWGMQNGCFTFRFGDESLGAEHTLWAIGVIPPASN